MSLPAQVEKVFSMPTLAAAQVLRLKGYGLQPGDNADVVVIDAEDCAEAIRFQSPRRWVIKRGQVVAETTVTREIFLNRRDTIQVGRREAKLAFSQP